MRNQSEVQRAHDMLSGIVLGDARVPELSGADTIERIKVALDVLCWMLHHDHNQTFADNLENIEKLAKKAGFGFYDHGN